MVLDAAGLAARTLWLSARREPTSRLLVRSEAAPCRSRPAYRMGLPDTFQGRDMKPDLVWSVNGYLFYGRGAAMQYYTLRRHCKARMLPVPPALGSVEPLHRGVPAQWHWSPGVSDCVGIPRPNRASPIDTEPASLRGPMAHGTAQQKR